MAAYLFSDCYDGIHFDRVETRQVSAISELVTYINDHLSEDLTLKKPAQKINYNDSTLCPWKTTDLFNLANASNSIKRYDGRVRWGIYGVRYLNSGS